MLALAITATVFLGISCVTCFINNVGLFVEELEKGKYGLFLILMAYSWLWRALAITTIWVLFSYLV